MQGYAQNLCVILTTLKAPHTETTTKSAAKQTKKCLTVTELSDTHIFFQCLYCTKNSDMAESLITQ